MLLVEGLTNPLHGWVRAYRPATLLDAMSRGKDMIDALPKTKAPILARHTATQGGRDTRQIHREVGHGHLDDETRRELWRRKFCFMCQEPWALGHKCTKGKAHYIEMYSDSEPDDEME